MHEDVISVAEIKWLAASADIPFFEEIHVERCSDKHPHADIEFTST